MDDLMQTEIVINAKKQKASHEAVQISGESDRIRAESELLTKIYLENRPETYFLSVFDFLSDLV